MGAVPAGRGPWPRFPRRQAGSVLLVVVVAVLGTGLRWWDPWDSRAGFDSLQYARVAYVQMGEPRPQAAVSAVRLRCDAWTAVHPAPGWFPVSLPRPAALYEHDCASRGYVPGVNPPYDAIFDSRPGYPWLVAALHPALGGAAFAVVSVAAGGLAVIGAGVIALLLGAGRAAAVGTTAALVVLPSGLYLTRIGPDGLVGLGTAVAVCGVALVVVRERLVPGAVVLAAGLLALIPVKVPDAVALGLSLAAVSTVVALRGGTARRRATVVGVTGAGAAALGLVTSWAMGWAGLQTTLQDLATRHFSNPPVRHPFHTLAVADRRLLTSAVLGHPAVLWAVGVAVVAAVGLLRRGAAGWLVLAAGGSGLVLVAVHPVGTEAARLAVPSWYAAALGLALLAEDVTARARGRPDGSTTSA